MQATAPRRSGRTSSVWGELIQVCVPALLLTLGGCVANNPTKPMGWRTLNLGKHLAFMVPADAVAVEVQPIDSIFGVLRGDGYEIIYDYGLSGENLAALKDQPGYTQHSRRFEGRMATEVSFRSEEKPGDMVQILQIKDGANLLTIRVSHARDDTGPLAQVIFDSVKFASGSPR